VTWLPFELHPETPAGGVSLAEYFGTTPQGLQQMHQGLKTRAAELGLPINPPPSLFNTHGALLLTEYAKEMGKAPAVHHRLFRANFVEGRNVAEPAVLRDVATAAGLDPGAAMAALQNPEYEERLSQSMAEARAYGVTGAPTFIIDDRYKIVGAQPYDSLLGAFRQIQRESRPS
jgi:predicted DsbA family dithiol-disulfide isomerase